MRGPFEVLADAYDYHFQYYRWFVNRRLLFSEISTDTIHEKLGFNIFMNKDYENIDQLVGKSTFLGFTSGKYRDFLF